MKNSWPILLVSSWLWLAACTSRPNSPTLSAPDLLWEGAQAQATLQAGQAQAALVNAQVAVAQQQGTRVALQLTSTPEAATREAHQTRDALQVEATQAALARQNADATATAGTAQTQDALQVARQVADITATANARATTTAIEAEHQRLALQREQTTNLIQTWAPWLVGAICFGLLVYAAWRLIPVLDLRLRTVRRGEHQSPLLLLDGHTAVIINDPDRHPSSVLATNECGELNAPAFGSEALNDRVIGRAQAIQMTAALPAGRSAPRVWSKHPTETSVTLPSVASAVPAATDDIVEGQVRVVPSSEMQPWLDEVKQKLLTEG